MHCSPSAHHLGFISTIGTADTCVELDIGSAGGGIGGCESYIGSCMSGVENDET